MDTPRPYVLDALTHAWCRATGRLFDVSEVPWLNDPPGPPQNVGGGALAFAASWAGLTVSRAGGIGLVDDFADLTGGPFDANRVAAAIRDFYQRTSDFELRITAESSGAVALAARAIIHLFSRRLGQLDLPMYVSGGEPVMMTSEVAHLRDDRGRLRYAAWSRNLPTDSNRPVYVGLYGHATPPKQRRPCVKVVFPLPLGTATVLLSPHHLAGDGLRLLSAGRHFGGSGFYFTLRDAGHPRRLWVRFVPQMHESIDILHDPHNSAIVTATHDLNFGSTRWLRLRYCMDGRQSPARGKPS